MKRIQGWKMYPAPYGDSELIRMVTSDPECSPLERALALRLDRMLHHNDQTEADMQYAKQQQGDLFDGYNA